MPNRIIKESIRTSKNINLLSDFQFRFWVYLITYVDDYGRGSADPELLKGLVFTRRKGITEKAIADALNSLANMGIIFLYEVDGESFLCFPNWEEHQTIRNKKSKFPAPDSNCNQLNSIEIKCSRNPIQSNTNTESNTEGAKHPTLEEVKAYIAEKGYKVDAVQFFNYYNEGNWHDKDGKPVKSWKQKVITWNSHETKGKSANKFHNFNERPDSLNKFVKQL